SRYQYTLQAVSAGELNSWAVKLQDKLRADARFRDVTSDSQMRGLQASLVIDRERAALLGVQMQDLRNALYGAFGERQVSSIYAESNTF
ncbi:efflux RND transporter permease subunit, partial [Klebsiella pneumoniae]